MRAACSRAVARSRPRGFARVARPRVFAPRRGWLHALVRTRHVLGGRPWRSTTEHAFAVDPRDPPPPSARSCSSRR